MAISKKAYAKKFGDALVENPRKFLRGHKIKSSAWKLFTPEVGGGAMLAELMYMGHSLVGAKKGPMALKKADNFLIRTYKTEGMLTDSLVDDVEEFVSGLSEKDAEEFEDNENIHVIGYYPQYAAGDPVTRLKLSVLLRNGYKGKFGKGEFVVIFFGNSALRTSELTFAKAKAKVNKKKVVRVTSPAKIKAKLKKKAGRKIGKIDADIAGLTGDAALMGAEMQQFNSIGKSFGLADGFTTSDLNSALMTNDYANEELMSGMTETEIGIWNVIKKEAKKNPKSSVIRSLIKGANSPALTALYKDTYVSSANKVGARSSEIKSKIRAINTRTRALKEKVVTLTAARSEAVDSGDRELAFKIGKQISAANFAIRKNANNVKTLKAKAGVHSSLGKSGVSYDDRAEMLAATNAEIEKLKALGASERQALGAALNKLSIDSASKAQLTANASEAVSQGVPAAIAAQQAFQEVSFQQRGDDEAPDGDDLDDVVMNWL